MLCVLGFAWSSTPQYSPGLAQAKARSSACALLGRASGCVGAAQEAVDAKIFVYVGPVEALSVVKQFPSRTVANGRAEKARKPDKWRADGAAVGKADDQHDLGVDGIHVFPRLTGKSGGSDEHTFSSTLPL